MNSHQYQGEGHTLGLANFSVTNPIAIIPEYTTIKP